MAGNDTRIIERIRHSSRVIASLEARAEEIGEIAERLRGCVHGGGIVFTCGNGGSAAEALHLAEELVGKYEKPRPSLAGVSLCADPTALTCIANDFGFEQVFSRQVESLVRTGDVLVGFSTSGNSENVIRAFRAAREKGAETIGLLGKGGGRMLALCDRALVVDSDDTAAIQEAHQVVVHLLLDQLESA